MIALLVLKEKLKQFYSKYSIYVTLAVKFLLGCLTFALISGNIGFMAKLNSPVILMGLAVVCAFLPYGVIVCLAAAVVLAHLSSVSLELTLILAVCFLIIAILYYSAWGQLSAAADSDFLSFQDPICHSASGWTFRKTGVCGSGGLWNICILYPSVCKAECRNFDK